MTSQVLSQEANYVVTNIKDPAEKWNFTNMPIVPKVIGNLTSEDIICKVEERVRLDTPRLATESEIKQYPEDVISEYYFIYERRLLGYYKCIDIHLNQTHPINPTNDKNVKIFKTLIISITIIIMVFGILYAILLKNKQQNPYLR
jgi:hypothetical protein